MKTTTHSRLAVLCGAIIGIGVLPGCTRDYKFSPVDMWNRSRLKPYEPVNFFDDKLSSRPVPSGAIARGELRTDDATFKGIQNGRFVNVVPAAITSTVSPKELIQRGQERYNIYCLPCHGASGQGDGMIVRRGFSPPPDYRIARLRRAPLGHFYDVITNGYGAMYSYSSRVPVNDRWAISAYIRRLQEVQTEVVPDVRYSPDKNKALYGTQETNQVGTSRDSGSASQMKPGGGEPEPKGPTQALPQNPVGTRSEGEPILGAPRTNAEPAKPGGNPALPSSGSTSTRNGQGVRGVPSNAAPRQPNNAAPSGQGDRAL